MDTTLLVGVVSAVLSAVLAGVLGLISGMVVERRRSGDVDRREHVRDVRTNVLEPLVLRVESYCLPVTCGRKPPLELVNVRQAGPVGDLKNRRDEYSEEFVPLARSDLHEGQRDLSLGRLDQSLFTHASNEHFPDLIRSYLDAESELSAWQMSLVRYAQEAVERLSDAIKVPVGRSLTSPPQIQLSIGTFLINRQLGVSDSTLYLDLQEADYPVEARIISNEQRIYGTGSAAEMERCLNGVSDMARDHVAFSPLQGRAKRLHAEFKEIVGELRVAASTAKLPGRCSYL